MLQEHTPSIGFALLSAHALLSLCMPLDVLRPTLHVRPDKDAMGSTHQGEVRRRPLLLRTARLVSPKVSWKENPRTQHGSRLVYGLAYRSRDAISKGAKSYGLPKFQDQWKCYCP